MADILIRGIDMPKEYGRCVVIFPDGRVTTEYGTQVIATAIPFPEGHGRLGDLDALRKAMYHEAFETDSPMQKWESGCWIRYKMFEKNLENAPIIVPAGGEH